MTLSIKQPKIHGRDFAANTEHTHQATPNTTTEHEREIEYQAHGYALLTAAAAGITFGLGALIIYTVSGVIYEFMNWVEGLPL